MATGTRGAPPFRGTRRGDDGAGPAFEDGGLENEAQIQATGRRFRATVLSLGGSRSPSEVFEAFRGRQPSTEALIRHSGLVAA